MACSLSTASGYPWATNTLQWEKGIHPPQPLVPVPGVPSHSAHTRGPKGDNCRSGAALDPGTCNAPGRGWARGLSTEGGWRGGRRGFGGAELGEAGHAAQWRSGCRNNPSQFHFFKPSFPLFFPFYLFSSIFCLDLAEGRPSGCSAPSHDLPPTAGIHTQAQTGHQDPLQQETFHPFSPAQEIT